jgi:hypothetical protein
MKAVWIGIVSVSLFSFSVVRAQFKPSRGRLPVCGSPRRQWLGVTLISRISMRRYTGENPHLDKDPGAIIAFPDETFRFVAELSLTYYPTSATSRAPQMCTAVMIRNGLFSLDSVLLQRG